jgi:cyclohexyl-isocyanide hydratase
MSSAPTMPGSQPPLQLGMLIYPDMTLLDLAGPQAALGLHGKTHLVWKTMDPVLTDSGISILPTATFADCPDDLDVLFVPGGFGTNEAMEDAEVLRFLADRGQRARYVTSVCSGSLILAAAGLLDGYKAATHWAVYDALEALGVTAERRRVVVDRNRFTGGGVTAGIDFGLTLLAELRGEMVAKMTQLMLEYDPKPPFDAGTPETAGPELTAMAMSTMQEMLDRAVEIARGLHRSQASAT